MVAGGLALPTSAKHGRHRHEGCQPSRSGQGGGITLDIAAYQMC